MSATTTPTPKAVLLGAYGTLCDVHSAVAAAEQMFPGHGEALSQLWRLKQIEYAQLRTLSDPSGAHYELFCNVTLDALRFSARKLGLTLNTAAEKRLMDEYACLSAFPDAVPVLRLLRDRTMPAAPATGAVGGRLGLAILSNGNPQMLDIAVKSSGMTGLFDHVLSVDAVRAYKPAPATYALGTQAFGVTPREIVFVSSNGWDAAGATWFGFTTVLGKPLPAPAPELSAKPHAPPADLADLPAFLDSLLPLPPDKSSGRTRHSPGA